MYAGDFTWGKESQAFFMRHKLSNGQFCMIGFYQYETNRAIEYYVAFAVADKKKALNGWFNGSADDSITLKMTGRCTPLCMYSKALARYGNKKAPTGYGWIVQKSLGTQQ